MTRLAPGNTKKGKKNKNQGRDARSAMPSFDAIAEQQTNSAFAPAIRAARGGVRDAQAQAPRLDAAYERSGDSINDVAKHNAAFMPQQAAAAQGGIVGAGDALSTAGDMGLVSDQLGKLGQTSKAAEDIAWRERLQSQHVAGEGGRVGAFLNALGSINGAALTGHMAANEAARGESHRLLRDEIHTRQQGVQDVRSKRASARSELAGDLKKSEDEFLIGLSAVNQREADSQRDFRLAMRGILSKEQQADLDRDVKRDLHERDAAIKEKALAAKTAHEKRLIELGHTKAEIDKIKALAKNAEVAYGVNGKGKYTYGTERGKETTSYTPGEFKEMIRGLERFKNVRNSVRQLKGKGRSEDEIRKALGLRALDWTIAKTVFLPGEKVPRELIPALRKWFPQGKIPNEIWERIPPPGK